MTLRARVLTGMTSFALILGGGLAPATYCFAAPSVVSVVDDNNSVPLVGNPLSGHTYRVTINVAAGDPNIKDLHIPCGSGVAVGGAGSGADVEVVPPSGLNAATNQAGYITMITTGSGLGLGNHDFTIKIKHTGGTRAPIIYTNDGNNSPSNGVVDPVPNDTNVPTLIPPPAPTLSEWGVILLSVFLLGFGIYALRRRAAFQNL